jgi:hypothetical protein
MPNEEAGMRAVPVLLAVAAVAGAVEAMGAVSADAQCSVFNRHPCVPNVCSVFSRHPCVPEPLYPFSEDLRLTIVTAPSGQKNESPDAAAASATVGTADGERHRLDTIREMFDALRACWVPPPQDEARPGMQMSVRLSFKRSGQLIGAPRVTYASPDAPPAARSIYHDAIMAALERCTPLPFSSGLGGAIAGRPLAIRYVDNRDAQ